MSDLYRVICTWSKDWKTDGDWDIVTGDEPVSQDEAVSVKEKMDMNKTIESKGNNEIFRIISDNLYNTLITDDQPYEESVTVLKSIIRAIIEESNADSTEINDYTIEVPSDDELYELAYSGTEVTVPLNWSYGDIERTFSTVFIKSKDGFRAKTYIGTWPAFVNLADDYVSTNTPQFINDKLQNAVKNVKIKLNRIVGYK